MFATERLRRIEQDSREAEVLVSRRDLRVVLDRLDALEALERRIVTMREEVRPVGNRAPGPKYRLAVQLLGEA